MSAFFQHVSWNLCFNNKCMSAPPPLSCHLRCFVVCFPLSLFLPSPSLSLSGTQMNTSKDAHIKKRKRCAYDQMRVGNNWKKVHLWAFTEKGEFELALKCLTVHTHQHNREVRSVAIRRYLAQCTVIVHGPRTNDHLSIRTWHTALLIILKHINGAVNISDQGNSTK